MIQKTLVVYGWIYEYQNIINGKRYIGQTIRKDGNRWNQILSIESYNSHLINSINKHGKENFERKILDFAENEEELNEKEKFYIQKFKTFDPNYGYNKTLGGDSGKKTDETKKKMSKAQEGNKKMLGKHHSPETKMKLSEARKGNKNPMFDIHLSKEKHWNYGKRVSEETKRKISRGNKGKVMSLEARKKISEAHKGKPNGRLGKHHSEETKKKISESNKGRIVSLETRKKISESNKGKIAWNKGKHFSEEHKKRISEKHQKNRSFE